MGTQAWTTFVWPNPSSQPGASIRAKDYDGRDFTVFEEAGSFGVEKLINSARRTELGNDVFEMAWSGDGITISVRFRIISGSGSSAIFTGQGHLTNPFTGMKLPEEIIALGVTRTARPCQFLIIMLLMAILLMRVLAPPPVPTGEQNTSNITPPARTSTVTPNTNSENSPPVQPPTDTTTATDDRSAVTEQQEQTP